MNYGLKKYNIIQTTVIIHAVVNDHSSHYSTTCTTRTCIEYDYMHMHVRTLHYMYATNYAECSI